MAGQFLLSEHYDFECRASGTIGTTDAALKSNQMNSDGLDLNERPGGVVELQTIVRLADCYLSCESLRG